MLWLIVSACAAPSSTASPPVSPGREAAYACAVIRRAVLASRSCCSCPPSPERRTPAPTPPPRWTWASEPGPRGSTSTATARRTTAASLGVGRRSRARSRRARASAPRTRPTRLDWGYATAQRMWGDVNGDRKADYCRRGRQPGRGRAGRLHALDRHGLHRGRQHPPEHGREPRQRPRRRDRRRDRRLLPRHGLGPLLRDLLPTAPWAPRSAPPRSLRAPTRAARSSTSPATARPTSAASRPCSPARCRPAPASASDIASFATDLGYAPGRAWADVNGDGKADYCRRVGNGGADARIGCTLSTGTGFGEFLVSDPVEWGLETGFAWVGLRRRRRPRLLPARHLDDHRAVVLHAVDAERALRHDRLRPGRRRLGRRVGRPQRRRQGRLLPADRQRRRHEDRLHDLQRLRLRPAAPIPRHRSRRC